jgi:site-specific DNA-cytosine methylase
MGGLGAGVAHATHEGKCIKILHAVENDADACRAYRLNHPGVRVHHSDADIFLAKLQGWGALLGIAKRGDAAVEDGVGNAAEYNPDADAEEEWVVKEISDFAVFDGADAKEPITRRALAKGGRPVPLQHDLVCKARGVGRAVAQHVCACPALLKHVCLDTCTAPAPQVKVHWERPRDGTQAKWQEVSWEARTLCAFARGALCSAPLTACRGATLDPQPLSNLTHCSQAVGAYLRKNVGMLPRPGEVDVVMGGPPCQGFSGNNRNRSASTAPRHNVSQMEVFMRIVLFLRPKFVLLENVCDVLNFQGGVYARRAIQLAVEGGMQAQLVALSAGAFGCAQKRLRVVMMLAAPGQFLPPVPRATHLTPNIADVLWDMFKCRILAAPYAADAAAHGAGLEPQATLGIALGDLLAQDTLNDEQRAERCIVVPAQNAFQALARRPRPGAPAVDAGEPHVVRNHAPARLSDMEERRLRLVGKRSGADHRDIGAYATAHPAERTIIGRKGRARPLTVKLSAKGTPAKWERYARLWYDEAVGTVTTVFGKCVRPQRGVVCTAAARLQLADCLALALQGVHVVSAQPRLTLHATRADANPGTHGSAPPCTHLLAHCGSLRLQHAHRRRASPTGCNCGAA